MNNELNSKIEAVLFYLAEPTSKSFLAKTLEVSSDEIDSALSGLKESLSSRGVKLVELDGAVTLVTAPEFGGLIEKIIKEERERDLGRAGIETLSIIAYKGPIGKREIEYIRGVNCQYALRNLLLRGLVEKKNSETDSRMIVYSITLDTLRYLGINSVTELPEYSEVKSELNTVEEVMPEETE
jgi:segregation and condensation protein B